jgi:AcrR family transcriptional regulator
VSVSASGDEARTDVERGSSRRRYSSPLREQRAKQTRATVLDVASGLFTTRGWAATGMRDVARAAGVATETVYAHFSSKTDLLRQVVNIAVVGDEDAVPLAQRPEFIAIGHGPRDERIAAAAQLLTEVHVRTAGFAKVIREAAHTDEAMADELDSTRRRQRTDVERALALLIGRNPTAQELDGILAVVSVEVYLLLTEFSQWNHRQFEAWMAETLELLVPRS